MLVNQKPLVFSSHERRLVSSTSQRPSTYLNLYLRGEPTLRRHPFLTFRHRLLEHTIKPKDKEEIISLHTLAETETNHAIAAANYQVANVKALSIFICSSIIGITGALFTFDVSKILANLIGTVSIILGTVASLKTMFSPSVDYLFSRISLGIYNGVRQFTESLVAELSRTGRV